MYKEIIEKNRDKFTQALDHFKHELSSIRTGRAHPSLVENIMVESYGSQSPIKNLAGLVVTDSKTLTIQPWDKSLLPFVQKAISSANIGISPVNDGVSIRLNIPPMTEERRLEMVKLMRQQAETARIRMRNIREDIWKELVKLHKDKLLTDDQKYDAQEELKKIIEDLNGVIKKLSDDKEKEIMTV